MESHKLRKECLCKIWRVSGVVQALPGVGKDVEWKKFITFDEREVWP